MENPNEADKIREHYLSPAQVCEIVPGMTEGKLRQLRYLGKGGPRFLKPSARTVVYRESDVLAWLDASERTITGSAVA